MASIDQSKIRGKIRDRPIGADLSAVLLRAAEAADIDVVMVTSGSQPGTHRRRTGSTRHDHGKAADLELWVDGRALTFSDDAAPQQVLDFVTAAASFGANGIGAGMAYMGNKTLHVGFGETATDRRQMTWGAGGRSANAPLWLRRAARAGWANPRTAARAPVAPPAVRAPATEADGRFEVAARGGLHLRKGPGLEWGITRTLEAGTIVTVLGFDGRRMEWARVDLEDDGLVDGHLFAAFLRPVHDGHDDGPAHGDDLGDDQDADEHDD